MDLFMLTIRSDRVFGKDFILEKNDNGMILRWESAVHNLTKELETPTRNDNKF